MRKYATELIGTFFLVFTICASVRAGAALAPIAIGGVLAAMVFAGGHISGAHYNPAVTLAVYLRGRMPAGDLLPYWAAQLAGGLLAALASRGMAGAVAGPAFTAAGHLGAAFAAEIAVTFALAYVVLNVATSRDHPDNSFYGLAIGLTVLAGAVAFGGLSGGVFNPAVAIGVSTAGLVSWSMLWLYLVANLAGGAAAAVAFRVLNPTDLAAPAPAGTAAAADMSVTAGTPAAAATAPDADALRWHREALLSATQGVGEATPTDHPSTHDRADA
jgi:aquaporin Z